MPCQHYKDALMEAAASGAEPQGELRAHLDACLDCRAAFEQEQSLFASIDSGVRVSANTDVPASLLPRVRARLDEAVAGHGWFTHWFALASATVLLVAFFATRTVWRTNVVQKPVETAVKTSVTPLEQNHDATIAPPAERNFVPQRPLGPAKNTRSRETLVSGKVTPEVLVPGDQEALLAEYAEQWRAHKWPMLLAQEFDSTILLPLKVAPIQIDQLDVKLLAEEKLQ
jgi:hypothetical protein